MFTVIWQNIEKYKNFYYNFTSQVSNYEKFYINKCIVKLEKSEKLKEIDIKNRRCYYFDDIIKLKDFDFNRW